MGETVCFETWNQLNQLAFYLLYTSNGRNKAFQSSESTESLDHKMIQCFKALEKLLTAPAGQNYVNAMKTQSKHASGHLLQTNYKCFSCVIYEM